MIRTKLSAGFPGIKTGFATFKQTKVVISMIGTRSNHPNQDQQCENLDCRSHIVGSGKALNNAMIVEYKLNKLALLICFNFIVFSVYFISLPEEDWQRIDQQHRMLFLRVRILIGVLLQFLRGVSYSS